MNQTICDRCGEVVTYPSGTLAGTLLIKGDKYGDLCGKCMAALEEWMKQKP